MDRPTLRELVADMANDAQGLYDDLNETLGPPSKRELSDVTQRLTALSAGFTDLLKRLAAEGLE